MIEPIITSYANGRITATHGTTVIEEEISIEQVSSSEYLQAHMQIAEKLARALSLQGRFYAAVGTMGGYVLVRSLFEDDVAFKIG